jgi:hypothetical protein
MLGGGPTCAIGVSKWLVGGESGRDAELHFLVDCRHPVLGPTILMWPVIVATLRKGASSSFHSTVGSSTDCFKIAAELDAKLPYTVDLRHLLLYPIANRVGVIGPPRS